MKKIMKTVILGFTCCFALATGIWLYSYQREYVISEIKDCFHNAVSNDLTIRWKKLDLPIYHHVSAKKTDDSIAVKNKEGAKTIPAFEKTISEDEKYKSILQTTLRYENPVNANALDSIYQVGLREQNLLVKTAVCYTDKVSGEVYKSNNDTFFYKKTYLLPPVVTGIEKEIVLQAFADVTFFSVIRNSIALFAGWAILCVVLVILAVSFLYKNTKQVVTISGDELLEKEDVEIQITDDLILNAELRVLRYGESIISLTDQSISLLKLFLSHKDYFVSNDDIRKHLWGTIDYSESCRSQAIKRLRDSLKGIPVLHIENLRGVGFCLKIDDDK